MTLDDVYAHLKTGDISVMTKEVILYINRRTFEIINIANNPRAILDNFSVHEIEMIILISNILYNNTDGNLLPLEDEFYDKLQILYKKYFPNSYSIGAPEVDFGHTNENLEEKKKGECIFPFRIPDNNMKVKDMMFASDLAKRYVIKGAHINEDSYEIGKRLREVQHLHPTLAGTLDKCNFVLVQDAVNAGIDVKKDQTVQIFERDFMQKHCNLFGMRTIPMVIMLKYDGVAVEADCTDQIVSARTRGDVDSNQTTDITPILAGYKFPNARPLDTPVGVQFEAIIDYYNLQKLNQLTGKNYVNGRTAIIGLLGLSDARKYMDFITLVPVDADIPEMDKLHRLEFCNQFYATRIPCIYEYFDSSYQETLFLVHKFVYEAQNMRPVLPFMYDGVVTEFVDPNLVRALGRKNSVNQYMMAIKFNALKKLTRFLGYTYSISQNGEIVPLLHYMPVSLMGTVHTKTTGHSFARFRDLDLRENDIIEIEYRNDVIPYATKPMIPDNIYNPNPPIPFPDRCPCCGSPVYFSEKQAFCTNIVCPERVLAKTVNMLAKLGITDVSEERVKALGVSWFHQFMEMDSKHIYSALGEAIGDKLIAQINDLKNKPIEDYVLLGSLGFSNVAKGTWKLILANITLDELLYLNDTSLYNRLIVVKGLGKERIDTICNQRGFFDADIRYILNMSNVVKTTGLAKVGTNLIAVTGFRPDAAMMAQFSAIDPSIEITESVTRNTKLLLVPMDGFVSTKTQKANKYNIPVIPIPVFFGNPKLYV